MGRNLAGRADEAEAWCISISIPFIREMHFELMPRIPDGVIDLIITDPPFAIDFKAQRENYNRSGSQRHGRIQGDSGGGISGIYAQVDGGSRTGAFSRREHVCFFGMERLQIFLKVSIRPDSQQSTT